MSVAHDNRKSDALICVRHHVAFVRFGSGRQSSFGCPVCVGLIRAKVQLERDRGETSKKSPKRRRVGLS